MAAVSSLNSLSVENPKRPASLLTATTGNTTLMVFPLTPRVLVLAALTGVPPVVTALATSAAPALPAPPGVPDGASMSQATSATTMAMTMAAVRNCIASGRRRRRRQDRPNGARGLNALRCAVISMLASILTLLHGGPCRRPPPSVPRPEGPRRSHQGRRPGPSGQRGSLQALPRPPRGPAP